MPLLTAQDCLTYTTGLMGNKEQNLFWPPYIATAALNLTTNYILDELVRIYPNSQLIVDKASPFLKRKIVAVNNGLVTLPDDYRNILSVGIAVNDKHTSKCECSEEEIREADCIDCLPNGELEETCNDQSILYNAEKAGIRAEKCKFVQVEQLDVDQFFKRTTSKLRPPTYDKPIYTFRSKTELKICPFEVSHVEILYIRQPKIYNIAYVMMPDDTWQINTLDPTHVDLEWDVQITSEFFRAYTSLYSIHTRDGNLVNWTNALKKGGLF